MDLLAALLKEMVRGASQLGSEGHITILLTFAGIAGSIITGFSLRSRGEYAHAQSLAPFVGLAYWVGVAILTLALLLPDTCWIRNRAVMWAYLHILAGCFSTFLLILWSLPAFFAASIRLRVHTGPWLWNKGRQALRHILRLENSRA